MNKLLLLSAMIVATCCPPRCCRAENRLFDLLLSRGVTLGPREVARLPAPTLADGLGADAQRRAIESITDAGHSWEQLTRHSVVAPFILKISQDADGNQGAGRHLDIWFVAYGDLKTLGKSEFLERQFKSAASESDAENGPSIKVLSEADLTRRGLKPPNRPEDPVYVAVEFTLLDRLRLQVTTRGVKTETNDSIVSASIIDPRFLNDRESPNRWRLITRDDAGRRHFGAPQPYGGFGEYAKATRLIDPQGAIFVEYHAAFAEPQEWFSGTNLLRSKLPLVAQVIVRQMRRDLAKNR